MGPPEGGEADRQGEATPPARTPSSMGEAESTVGEPERPRVDVGVLVAHAPRGDEETLRGFAERMVTDGVAELSRVTDTDWRPHGGEPTPLPDSTSRRPSEFLDEASLRMVRGPYDVVVVVTDVPLTSRGDRPVPGLASPIGRIVVVTTRGLRAPPGEGHVRALDSPAVRWNAATLLVHLVGHVLGARHGDGGPMESFHFDPERREVPPFDAEVRRHLRQVASRVPEETTTRGRARRLVFHVTSVVRNPGKVVRAVAHSQAPLLPLSLPKLATAAVTPAIILVFSAETWDVGLNLDDGTAVLFAAASILAAAVHLMFVQNLFFPREPSQVITEHMALVNVSVFFILVLAMTGLFALVGAIILAIELVVFPPNLMTNWPSLENPAVNVRDLVRIGAFISTLSVLSGALAGGIESRTALRHLALFLDRP